LVERESELVSGFNVEHFEIESGLEGLTFIAEYGIIILPLLRYFSYI